MLKRSLVSVGLFVLFGAFGGPALAQDVFTLEEALERAKAENIAVQVARNTSTIADNDASLGNAGFLPRLSASANRSTSITTSEQQFIDQDPRRTENAEETQQGAAATLDWTAFDGLGRFATLRRLRAERDAASQRVRGVTASVLTDVTLAYLTIVREQQRLAVLEETLDISQERFRLTEVRNRLGTASDLELGQARVDRNADRGEVLRQQSTLNAARAQLNRLLNLPDADPYQVEPEIPIDDALDLDVLMAGAQQQNPDVRVAELTRNAAAEERREIRSERLPTLDLQLRYQYSDQTSESGFVQFSESYGFSYGFTLSVDLFDGLNRRRRAQNAQVRERNATLAIQELETEVVTALQEEFVTFENRIDLLALEEENVSIARDNAATALRQFELGAITPLELREVQEALAQAESRLVDTRFEARASEAALRELAGLVVMDL